MNGLNANQVRHVLATFRHVDTLLQRAERLLVSNPSPFASERIDLAPVEAGLLQSHTELVRARMVDALDRLSIARPPQTQSARWSVETTLRLAEIALSELGRDSLRGSGAVDEVAADELEVLAAELRAGIGRAMQALHDVDPGGLVATVAGIPGVAGAILRDIEHITRERALAEVRPLLTAAVERATSTTFDVGVFGRVSSGKSSLINALVGADVLPVGATPVTAVPVRVSRGPSRAVVHFLEGADRVIDPDDVGEFATEQHNPHNRLGVRSIDMTAPPVPRGLRLMDTPGVGSLRSSGGALAFKWLPHCDLGLVMVAAATAVGREELALVTGLSHAGIRCQILLSKADLLAPHEVYETLAYLRREFAAAARSGSTITVTPISTISGEDEGLTSFRNDVLAPLARDCSRKAQQALMERLERLIEATAGALGGRRSGGMDADLELHRVRMAAERRVREAVNQLEGSVTDVLDHCAHALAGAWQGGGDGRHTVRGTILRQAGEALESVRAAIDPARQEAGVDVWERRRVPPMFDPEFLDALPDLSPPAVGRRVLGTTLARRRLDTIAESLASAMSRYALALSAWAGGVLEEMHAAEPLPGSGIEARPPLPPELARLMAMLRESGEARTSDRPGHGVSPTV
jgi:GTP-binding protein EngB required for normal cell division